jgi:chromosome segregation ATPase
MIMTAEQKYSAVLKELGEVLQSKNTTISCQQWQIDSLKAKLDAAEKERDNALVALENAAMKLLDAQNEIDELKGGAE